MAADAPLNSLVLRAKSVADDLGYVALSDMARALNDIAADYRVIGGQMVTTLAARWQLAATLYRETGDLDLGVPPIVARDQRVVGRIKDVSYVQIAGNRFARELSDIPVTVIGGLASAREALVDVLVPAYTSRARGNVQVGDDLFTTDVPGLQLALARPPAMIDLELCRLNGETLRCRLPFADELSALILKGLATRARTRASDIGDVWRCLEIAIAAGLRPTDFASPLRLEGSQAIRALFAGRNGPGMTALAAEQNLSRQAADDRFTGIGALIAAVLGRAPLTAPGRT